MWQTGAGGMGSHAKNNPWMKLMGIVHKERRQPSTVIVQKNSMNSVQTLRGHAGRVWSANWSPDGMVLASCGEDKTIRLWAASRGEQLDVNETPRFKLKTLLADGHQRTVRSVCWSPCGTYLASASFDSTVAIWERKSGKAGDEFECDTTLEGHENEVKAVAWSESGRYLASCSRDKSVWIWAAGNDDNEHGDDANCFECAAVLNSHSQDVKKVVWHPIADILASASYDNTVKIYELDADEDDWTCVDTLASHQSTVWSIAFDASGERLASCSDDLTVKIWKRYEANNAYGVPVPADNRYAWKCVCTLSGYHTRSVYDVSWCHLTGMIATACADDNIRIFVEANDSDADTPTFQLLISCQAAHTADVNCVRWNPKLAGVLASCSDDGDVKIWKVDRSVDAF